MTSWPLTMTSSSGPAPPTSTRNKTSRDPSTKMMNDYNFTYHPFHTILIQSNRFPDNKIMNSISIPPPLDKPHQLLCFICQDILAKPLTASCGHSFCLLCLDQYLLFADTCPICSKTIRGKPLNPVPCLSDFISSIVKTDHEERSRLQSRIQRTKDFMKRRELKGIKVGMMVDIRDVNNIWCVGMVVRIITRYQQPVRLLKINYINYLQKKEEEVPMNSDRLAAKGFYTSRKDIPHYPSRPVHSILNKYQI